MDCHFTEKSGQGSHGPAWFHNGKTGRAEKGLEFSELAIIDCFIIVSEVLNKKFISNILIFHLALSTLII